MSNLQKSIKVDDILYFLGDLTFKRETAIKFFEMLDGVEIHYIIGNHDSREVVDIANRFCSSVTGLIDIRIQDQSITLCHYAMRVWNKSHFNAWQLYGHSHGGLDSIGKQYDVGIDNNNYHPISFENLKVAMEKRPDNFNYIAPEKRRPV